MRPFIGAGQTITYTLSFNLAVGAGRNVTLTDPLPANLTYVPGSASALKDNDGDLICTPLYQAGTLTWNIGSLPFIDSNGYPVNNGKVTFQATVDEGVAAGTHIANTASIACAPRQPRSPNP